MAFKKIWVIECQNDRLLMTPENNEIVVLSNNALREEKLITNPEKYSGYTTMDIMVDNVVVEGIGTINGSLIVVNKRFNNIMTTTPTSSLKYCWLISNVQKCHRPGSKTNPGLLDRELPQITT